MAAAILLLAAAALTNRWMSFASGMRLVQAHDERSYRAIAGAAPSLPSEHLPIQHAERWPVHWLVGSLADLFGVSLDTAYRVAMAIAVVAVVGVVALVIRRLAPAWPCSC